MSEAVSVCVAVVTGGLDWSHRSTSSHDKYDAGCARNYIESHVEGNLFRMEQAAQQGARLVVGQEYFTGSELFCTTPENKQALLEATNLPTIEKLKTLAGKYGIWLACAFQMYHGEIPAETGVIAHPDGKTVSLQIKNTSVPDDSPLVQGYCLFDMGFSQTGMFTCSDATTYPEDCIALAKQGMQVMLLPGCGFAHDDWFHYLKVRSQDLSCAVLYADEGRAAILDANGDVLARTDQPDTFVAASVQIAPKTAVQRLRSSLAPLQ